MLGVFQQAETQTIKVARLPSAIAMGQMMGTIPPEIAGVSHYSANVKNKVTDNAESNDDQNRYKRPRGMVLSHGASSFQMCCIRVTRVVSVITVVRKGISPFAQARVSNSAS